MGERWPEAIRRRKGAEALRRYAALLAEHERVRRLLEESAADPEAMVAPSGAAWKPLREMAFFHGTEQRAAALRAFCSEFVVPVEPRTGGGAVAPEGKGRTAVEGMGDVSSRGLPRPREGREDTPENTLPRAQKPAGGEDPVAPEGTPENTLPRARKPAGGKERIPDAASAEEISQAVPMRAYREALAAAVELAGDEIVANGAEAPWGAGLPRAPRSAEAFEAICRRLRDGDTGEHGMPSLAAVLDSVELPPVSRVERLVARVTYDLAHHLLKIGETRIFLPEGREREFLRVLVERRGWDRLTPPVEHGIVWKNAIDQLRARIRLATGRSLLREVIVPAKGRTGAYRLNPNVRVRNP